MGGVGDMGSGGEKNALMADTPSMCVYTFTENARGAGICCAGEDDV